MQLQLNFDSPLSEGTFKGVKWRSLTLIGQAQSDMIEKMLRDHNYARQLFGLPPTGHAQMLQVRFGMTLSEWSNNWFTPEKYYIYKGKYLNNYEVK